MMNGHQTVSRNWRLAIIGASLLALGLKVYLALSTLGTNDVLTWQSFLSNIREFGGIGTYQRPGIFGDPFNHPPFMIHGLRILGTLVDITHMPFPFWLRFPATIADMSSLWVIWRLKAPPVTLFLLALCPASILISGFHGNTDPVMIFLVLLSIYIIERNGYTWLAGLAFGMAINIKVVPLIFIPVFFFYLAEPKKIIEFFGVAVGTVFFCSLPYILIDPVLIARRTLGYGSTYNRWGWSLILSFLFLPNRKLPLINYNSAILHSFLFTYLKYALLAVIIFLSWRMNKAGKEVSLFFQCGTIICLFLTSTPGFGVQYLAWLIPFIVVLGVARTLLYYITSGIYLFATYSLWSDGAWFYADSKTHQTAVPSVYLLSLLCWGAVLLALIKYLRAMRRRA